MNSTTLTPSLQNFSLFDFPLRRGAKPSPKTARFPRNSPVSLKPFSPLHPLRVRCSASDDKADKNLPRTQQISLKHSNGGNNALDVAKPIAYALFYVFIGVFCPLLGFQKPALAAAASSATIEEKGHKYSQYTRRLLATVSKLVKVIEEARNAGNEDFAVAVEEGLKEVKRTKTSLQEEILNGLYSELSVLKAEKEALMDRTEEIVSKSSKLKKEEQGLMRKAKGGGDKLQRLREEKRSLEREYNDIWGRIGEIEDLIESQETIALSIGVRELLSIERECEALVKNVLTELRSQGSQR